MSDKELIESFENCNINPERFTHAEHVRLAWSYLAELPLPEAMVRMRDGLKKLTVFLNNPGRYHETITYAYLMLVNERRERGGGTESWSEFAEKNGDLFARNPSVLEKYYPPEILNSDFAKRTFVWPQGC